MSGPRYDTGVKHTSIKHARGCACILAAGMHRHGHACCQYVDAGVMTWPSHVIPLLCAHAHSSSSGANFARYVSYSRQLLGRHVIVMAVWTTCVLTCVLTTSVCCCGACLSLQLRPCRAHPQPHDRSDAVRWSELQRYLCHHELGCAGHPHP